MLIYTYKKERKRQMHSFIRLFCVRKKLQFLVFNTGPRAGEDLSAVREEPFLPLPELFLAAAVISCVAP